MNKTVSCVLTAGVIAGLALTGCGSSGSDNASDPTGPTADVPTVEQFCTDITAAFDGFEPGFDAIFEGNPEPTLEDWAAFLPAPLAEFDAVIERAKTVTPPPDLEEGYETVIQTMEKVSANFHDGIEAAEAGDEDRFDELEEKNQSTDLPAMQAAFDNGPDPCASEG